MAINKLKFFLPYQFTTFEFERKIFLIAVFLLPSAFSFASILFLVSSSIGVIKNFNKLKSDRLNYVLLIISILLIISCLVHTNQFEGVDTYQDKNSIYWDPRFDLKWKPSFTWIGLFNWLPLFLVFIGSQPYLKNHQNRNLVAKFLLAGTIPVLFSGLAQYFFKSYGPYEVLNGLLIWYQKPIDINMSNSGLSGLFSNKNYMGCWLNIVFPFSLSIFFENKKYPLKRSILLIIILIIALSLALTGSRNSWLGFAISIPLIFGISSFYWILSLVILLIGLIYFADSLPSGFRGLLETITPEQILLKLQSNYYQNYQNSRLDIYFFALKMISQRPLFGWGAGSFGVYTYLLNEEYAGHAHNLLIDFAFNYGAIVSIMFFAFLGFLCFFSFTKIFLINSNISFDSKSHFQDKAWWASCFILILSQIFDIQYFDGRISISLWILLAGLRMILISEKVENK